MFADDEPEDDVEQLQFDFDDQVPQSGRAGVRRDEDAADRKSEAKRSINYVLDAVLQFGKVSSGPDLLDRIARLCLSTGYSPYNALLMLLQRPAASYVLPAHRWRERYGYVIRPGEQPLVLLQRGGPLIFLLDVSQVEAGENAIALPADLSDPYAMTDIVDAEQALHWIVENAKYDGVRVSPAPLGTGFAGCVRRSSAARVQRVTTRKRPEVQVAEVPVRYDVELSRSHSATEQLATLAHELGHVYCGHLGSDDAGHWRDRSRLDHDHKELEAECVARCVFSTLAPGVTLPDHLDQYFAVEPELHGTDLQTVLRAAGRVLDISRRWAPRWTSSRTATR